MDEPLPTRPAFGRRLRRTTQASFGGLQPRPPSRGGLRADARPAMPQPFVAHYSLRMALLGLSLLSIGYKLAGAGFAFYGGRSQMEVIGLLLKGKGGDGAMFVMSGAFAAIIGLAWLLQGLTRGRALTIDQTGVCGFTVLGTKRFDWKDVDRIEIVWHVKLKRQMTVHGKLGAPSVGYLVTGIPVSITRLDRREADVLAAIAGFAPHVPIVDLGGKPSWPVLLLLRMTEHLDKLGPK